MNTDRNGNEDLAGGEEDGYYIQNILKLQETISKFDVEKGVLNNTVQSMQDKANKTTEKVENA